MPLPPYTGAAKDRVRGGRMVGRPVPRVWFDSALDQRVVLSATNTTGVTLHDHTLTATVPSGIDATHIAVIETTSDGFIDRPHAWRYGRDGTINRMPFLPASLSGTTLTIKALGAWTTGTARTFALYWDTRGFWTTPAITHLGGKAQAWTATFTAGTAGNVYTLVVGGQTYTYTMIGGDTATVIAQAIRTQINAGTVATATGAAAVLSITQTNAMDPTFTVANTGTTTPGNLVVVKPLYFGLTRTGPDTDVFTPGYGLGGLPYSTGVSVATFPGWGHNDTRILRARLYYEVNPASSGNSTTATISALTNTGPTITATGAFTMSRSEWTATYSETYHHKIVTGRKSDDTGANTLLKYVDVHRVTLTLTCGTAYTPTNNPMQLVTMCPLDNGFGGNVTASAANKKSNWYADVATGTITTYGPSATITGVSTNGGHMIGSNGNTNGIAWLPAISFSGFGSQTPVADWSVDGNTCTTLRVTGLSNAAQVPQNATITITFWYAMANTGNGTTTGDYLLPDEVVSLMQGLAATSPTVTVGTTEYDTPSALAVTVERASSKLVSGCQWFADNALAYTGRATNSAFQKHLITGAYANTSGGDGIADEDDGNYGEAHKLHGLCLRYLRTHDRSLIAQIERQVQFHLDIEAAAVATYSSWYSGSAPYWYAVSATTRTFEGGFASGDLDTGVNGTIPSSTINYTQGQVRRLCSIDQMHMVAHGLYAYLYLLRNESAITANTTLQANARSYVGRMATYETARTTVPSTSRSLPNLNRIVNSLTPLESNGLTSGFTNPYNGDFWGSWQLSNADQVGADPSGNSTLDTFFRCQWSPTNDIPALIRFLKGRALDFTSVDMGHHDTTTPQTTWGVVGWYPKGFSLRGAANGNDLKYTAGRSGDDHYIQVNSGGDRDIYGGRTAQRLACLCLLALLDPTTTLTIDVEAPRTINIVTLCDQYAAFVATYQVEETTGAARWSVPGYLSSRTTKLVDSAFTGYALMALELWRLVNAGADYRSYYPIGLW